MKSINNREPIVIPPTPQQSTSNEELWIEFRNAGLLWWINRILHTFGWAIVISFDENDKVKSVYPQRVKYRGFERSVEEQGFLKISKYLRKVSKELVKEIRE